MRKCGLNTNDVLEQLQRDFKCQSVDIGVSGLKDKNAITEQWFSIRTAMEVGDTALSNVSNSSSTSVHKTHELAVPAGEFVVLESHRHSRKLRRGAHRHNRFTITVRDIVCASHEWQLSTALNDRLNSLQKTGFANYFGPQRFGLGYQNLPAAERYFANPKRKLSRNKRSLFISAARSHVFNSVCAERVKAGNWNVPLVGEPMLLDGSHSFFINDPKQLAETDCVCLPDTLQRCRQHDIHPTGPLWGKGDPLARGECEQFETSILQLYTSLCEGLEKVQLKQQRRALRAKVEKLQWHWHDPTTVIIDFELLKGVYATSFLSEFMVNLSA